VTELDVCLSDLARLIHRGRDLGAALAADLSNGSEPEAQARVQAATRSWQHDCTALVSRLSGGSKAHWLARAYSQAFLLRAPGGEALERARMADIVGRIVSVLEQADRSLRTGRAGTDAPPARRFEFVHNEALRPVLEQAYQESRSAFEEGRFATALVTSCGVLEAIITDRLEHLGTTVEPSFEARIAAAERAGLIRGGCARLPPLARRYRDLTDAAGELGPGVTVSEREARQAGQVLRVIMRDLDPGR
jgi:hypothetical protein